MASSTTGLFSSGFSEWLSSDILSFSAEVRNHYLLVVLLLYRFIVLYRFFLLLFVMQSRVSSLSIILYRFHVLVTIGLVAVGRLFGCFSLYMIYFYIYGIRFAIGSVVCFGYLHSW